jgi:prophage regulatory protein
MVNETKQLLGIEEVMQITNKKRATIFRHVKLNLFPAPVKTGIRSIAWRAEDVKSWIQNLSKSIYVKEKTTQTPLLDALRYRWLRRELVAGRERDISEGLNTEQELDDYIYKRMFDQKISEKFGG